MVKAIVTYGNRRVVRLTKLRLVVANKKKKSGKKFYVIKYIQM